MKKGITLIEVLLVIAILSILIVALLSNFLSSLKKGRDARRKNDLAQIQRALEIFYEDNQAYPSFTTFIGGKFCTSSSCAASDKVYMLKVPNDPTYPTYNYVYVPSATTPPQYYYLYSYIENDQDQTAFVSQKGFTTGQTCNGSGSLCRFSVFSPSAPALTPIP